MLRVDVARMGVIRDDRLFVLVATADACTASALRQAVQTDGSRMRATWVRDRPGLNAALASERPDVIVSDMTLGTVPKSERPDVIVSDMTLGADIVSAIEDALRVSRIPASRRTVVDSAAWRAAAKLTDQAFNSLDEREVAVMSELASGADNQTIGRHLGVSVSTVSDCVRRLRDKLGAHTRDDLISMSCRQASGL